jgi:hypothetical protein
LSLRFDAVADQHLLAHWQIIDQQGAEREGQKQKQETEKSLGCQEWNKETSSISNLSCVSQAGKHYIATHWMA